MAVAARTIDGSLGRLSQRVAVKVKPEDVPLNLRGEGSSHVEGLYHSPTFQSLSLVTAQVTLIGGELVT